MVSCFILFAILCLCEWLWRDATLAVVGSVTFDGYLRWWRLDFGVRSVLYLVLFGKGSYALMKFDIDFRMPSHYCGWTHYFLPIDEFYTRYIDKIRKLHYKRWSFVELPATYLYLYFLKLTFLSSVCGYISSHIGLTFIYIFIVG